MSRVVVRNLRLTLPRLPKALDGLRITHISDLHLRRWIGVMTEARRHLESIQSDLLVCTGDIGDHHCDPERSAQLMIRLVDGLTATLGCFAVLGNHDTTRLADLLSSHLKILSNEHVGFPERPDLVLAGLCGQSMSTWDIPAALRSIGETQFTVLLSHYPQVLYHLPQRVDLVLAGHTHGGQIRLPLIGPLCPYFRGLQRRYAWGLHQVSRTRVLVNAGLGYSRIFPARIFCPAEIVVLNLVHGG